MGTCLSRTDYQPFSREPVRYICGCLPWGNKSVPDYDYDESEDEMEFDTILAANTSYSSRYQNNRKLSAVWERIASIFNPQKKTSAADASFGYQSIPRSGSLGGDSDDSIFLNEEDAKILTSDQVDQITNNHLEKE